MFKGIHVSILICFELMECNANKRHCIFPTLVYFDEVLHIVEKTSKKKMRRRKTFFFAKKTRVPQETLQHLNGNQVFNEMCPSPNLLKPSFAHCLMIEIKQHWH